MSTGTQWNKETKTAEEIIGQIEKSINSPFVTAAFGDGWKEHAKLNYPLDMVIDIAWLNGRKAILLERELRRILSSDFLQAEIDKLLSDPQFLLSKGLTYSSFERSGAMAVKEEINRLRKELESRPVWVKANDIITEGRYCHDRKKWFASTPKGYEVGQVTHWMPLPTKPTDEPPTPSPVTENTDKAGEVKDYEHDIDKIFENNTDPVVGLTASVIPAIKEYVRSIQLSSQQIDQYKKGVEHWERMATESKQENQTEITIEQAQGLARKAYPDDMMDNGTSVAQINALRYGYVTGLTDRHTPKINQSGIMNELIRWLTDVKKESSIVQQNFADQKFETSALCAEAMAFAYQRVKDHAIHLLSQQSPSSSIGKEDVSVGEQLITQERERQIKEEGWTDRHDDQYEKGELSRASLCYEEDIQYSCWPWHNDWWKPKTPIRNRIRAGALLLAEKSRIDRRLKKISAEIDRLNNLNTKQS